MPTFEEGGFRKSGPYQEGFRACRADQTIHENPYATFTKEHAAWQAGWEEYDAHQTTKDDALDSIGWLG